LTPGEPADNFQAESAKEPDVKQIFSLVVLSLALALRTAGAAPQENAVEMQVRRVLIDPNTNSPVVVLESVQEKRLLPIWIGTTEASSIALEMENVQSPRPNTHDLIRNILQGLGATVSRITITDLKNNTYFAVVTLRLKGQEFQIDSRPSDAIAVALKMKAAIYASPQVLAKARTIPSPTKPRDPLRETIGAHLQDLTPELASLLDVPSSQGVLVADVDLGSRALEAGLLRGDVIVKANDKPIHKVGQLESLLKGLKRPGRLKLDVLRKGKPATVTLELPS
jgi:bifunctional DNase/RNase